MAKFDKVGGGSFGVYRKRSSDWGAFIGGLFIAFVVIAILANI